MALKIKFLLLCTIAGCANVHGISGITNYQDEVNIITEEDRRAALAITNPGQDLQISSSQSKSNYYLPPTYDSHHYDHSGAGGYGHSTGYHPNYYFQPPAYYGNGHTYGGYDGDHEIGNHRGQSGGHASGDSKGGLFSTLALKGILIPLAGIALLGAAAALSTNPVLLQLGVLNGRRRRSLPADGAYPVNPKLKPVKR